MSEEKKVRLKVVSVMTSPDGDWFETKNARRGVLREEGGETVIEYDDEQDGERAHVVLSLAAGRMPGENRAKMERRGMMSGTLTFLPGRRVAGSYVSIYGEIPVAVDTRSVEIGMRTEGGELRLDYDVYMGGERTSGAQLAVTWRL